MSNQESIGGPSKRSARLLDWRADGEAEIVTVLCWVDWRMTSPQQFANTPANLGYKLQAGLFEHVESQWATFIADALAVASFPVTGFRWTGPAKTLQLDVLITSDALNNLAGAVLYVNAVLALGSNHPPRYRVSMNRILGGAAGFARAPYGTTRVRAAQSDGIPATLEVADPNGGVVLTAIPVDDLASWRVLDASAFYFMQDEASTAAGVQVTLEFE